MRKGFYFLLGIPLFCPAAALAVFTGAVTLNTGQSVNLDTGAVLAASNPGGDILWDGTRFRFQGTATGFDFGLVGLDGNLGYDAIESTGNSFLSGLNSLFAAGPVDSGATAVGGVVALQTNGTNYAALIVTANTGNVIALQYVNFGASAPGGPFITQVMNNYSLIPAGLPNSAIAPGSLFIIQGAGLASATTVTSLQSSAQGLPTTLNGASVSITDSHGVASSPAFYYAINSQLALVMPSGVAPGLAILTVTSNGQTSQPFPVQIAATSPGFAAYYGIGKGLGIATDPASGAFFGYSNPIPPGASVVLWGSGLGADPDRDTTYAPGAFAINNLAQIYVGGVPAVVQYQGASGYPGVNQINVQIPQNAPTGCFVSVEGVTVRGIPTNTIVLPIGNGSCSEPALGMDTHILTQLSSQQNVNAALLRILYLTEPNADGSATQTVTTASATFETMPGANFGIGDGLVSLGGCILNKFPNVPAGSPGGTLPPGLGAGLVTLTPPGQFNKPLTLPRDTLDPGVYATTLPAGFLSTAGGTFTFTGSGGTQVGAFTAPVNLSDPLLSWTNQDSAAVVSRSGTLLIKWSGGDPGTLVTILGTAYGAGSSAQFLCAADAAAGQFTVPSWVLAAFPAGPGGLAVQNQTIVQSFSATGTDRTDAHGLVVTEIFNEYQ